MSGMQEKQGHTPGLNTRWNARGSFTAAPWRARKIRYGAFSIEAELPCVNGLSAWFTIATVHETEDAERLMSDGAKADAEDDARLIAAAPTMKADIDEFMRRLGPRWFLEQNWFPASVEKLEPRP
jgi:hypothetical protein